MDVRQTDWECSPYLTHGEDVQSLGLICLGYCLGSKKASFLIGINISEVLGSVYNKSNLSGIPMKFDCSFRTEAGSNQSTIGFKDSYGPRTIVISTYAPYHE
jgi:hypothetical protein